jgi:hypothetical protein
MFVGDANQLRPAVAPAGREIPATSRHFLHLAFSYYRSKFPFNQPNTRSS